MQPNTIQYTHAKRLIIFGYGDALFMFLKNQVYPSLLYLIAGKYQFQSLQYNPAKHRMQAPNCNFELLRIRAYKLSVFLNGFDRRKVCP